MAAGAAATVPLLGAAVTAGAGGGDADSDIPPDTLPGGAYDKYVALLAAAGKFSGVVLLSVILSNADGETLQALGGREVQAVTGARPVTAGVAES